MNKRFAALAALLLVAGCQEAEQLVEKPAPVVRVATVTLAPLEEVRSYTGMVVPRVAVSEAFRVGGRIAERLVDVGDRVEEGQVLARIDPTDIALQLEQQEAAQRAAEAALKTAEADVERARRLFKKGHIAKAALDARLLALDEVRSRHEQTQQGVALARNQMGYAELRASAPGAVSAALAETGQVVAAGQPVVQLARLDGKEVEVAIPENRIGDVKNARATAVLWAGEGEYAATLREVAPQADGTTRTYPVRFALPDADERAQLGMTATIHLAHGDQTPVAKVPMTALLDDGRGPAVFVLDPKENALSRRAVEVASYRAEDAVVRSGLENGDVIVTLGVQKLQDGLRVRPDEVRTAGIN